MKSLLDYKKNFNRDGFVKIEKLFNKKEIGTILNEINKIKKRFEKIKNPNLHLIQMRLKQSTHRLKRVVLRKGTVLLNMHQGMNQVNLLILHYRGKMVQVLQEL